MKLVMVMTALGLLFLGGSLASTVLGLGGSTSSGDTVPVSVRDNPSSYRPVYGAPTGYRPPGSTSSGGYSAGK